MNPCALAILAALFHHLGIAGGTSEANHFSHRVREGTDLLESQGDSLAHTPGPELDQVLTVVESPDRGPLRPGFSAAAARRECSLPAPEGPTSAATRPGRRLLSARDRPARAVPARS